MVESFAPHVGGEKPLGDLGMTESRTALLPLVLSLQGINPGGMTACKKEVGRPHPRVELAHIVIPGCMLIIRTSFRDEGRKAYPILPCQCRHERSRPKGGRQRPHGTREESTPRVLACTNEGRRGCGHLCQRAREVGPWLSNYRCTQMRTPHQAWPRGPLALSLQAGLKEPPPHNPRH
jgi:hypothetical protein